MISFTYLQSDTTYHINEVKLKTWLKNIVSGESRNVGDIHYIFCSDDYLHEINIKFLDHDTFTDIITFPMSEKTDVISGEIYISIDRVRENSKSIGSHFMEELMRVMAHGVLHLIGYGDHSEAEKKIMRGKEDYYLNLQA